MPYCVALVLRRLTRIFAPVVLLVAVAAVLAACGSSEDSGDTSTAEPVQSAKPEDFPAARGRSLAALQQAMPQGPILAPATSVLRPREANRFGFALVDKARTQIRGAQVALYYAVSGSAPARGPYVAREEELKVAPQFESRTTSQDPDAAKALYVAHMPFAKKGRYVVIAIARLDDRLVASTAIQVAVGGPGPPPVGARAPRIHTPTVEDVAGNVEAIDTRIPPDSMHDADFADVVGKKPVVLVFATPQLCQSRVCGPIVDVVEQVKSRFKDRATFIHMEIYNDNRIEKGFRPQVRRYNLPTEPWLFAIDKRGRIAAEIEGAASVDEVEAAVEKAIKG